MNGLQVYTFKGREGVGVLFVYKDKEDLSYLVTEFTRTMRHGSDRPLSFGLKV